MKNESEKMLLTSDLYKKISTDKTSQIVSLREEKTEKISSIKSRLYELRELCKELKAIKIKIKNKKSIIRTLRRNKFKLDRKLSKQNRLAKKLNKSFRKEGSYIEVDSFYPEIKKR